MKTFQYMKTQQKFFSYKSVLSYISANTIKIQVDKIVSLLLFLNSLFIANIYMIKKTLLNTWGIDGLKIPYFKMHNREI